MVKLLKVRVLPNPEHINHPVGDDGLLAGKEFSVEYGYTAVAVVSVSISEGDTYLVVQARSKCRWRFSPGTGSINPGTG
jgi:hypothetical protein